MSIDERFASLLGAWPPVGLLPRPDPAQGQVQGLLPAQPAPQSALGVLGVPGDPASLFAPPFDPRQAIGGWSLANSPSPLDGSGWPQALQALHDSLGGASQPTLIGADPAGSALGPSSPGTAGWLGAGFSLAPAQGGVAANGDPDQRSPALATIAGGEPMGPTANMAPFRPILTDAQLPASSKPSPPDPATGHSAPPTPSAAHTGDAGPAVSHGDPSVRVFQPGDQNLLARMIFAETGGIADDYPAIGWAVANRVGTREFGETLNDVLQHPNAFAFLRDGGSPLWNASADPSKLADGNAKSWAEAQRVAAGIVNGFIPDPTGGATLFFSSDRYTPDHPQSAPGGFPSMLRRKTISPSAYASGSRTSNRNYFFVER